MKLFILLIGFTLVSSCGKSNSSNKKNAGGTTEGIQKLSPEEINRACGSGSFNLDIMNGVWDSDISREGNVAKSGLSLEFINSSEVEIGFYCIVNQTSSSAEYSADYAPADYTLSSDRLSIRNHSGISILGDRGETVCKIGSLNGEYRVGTYGSQCIFLDRGKDKIYFKQI